MKTFDTSSAAYDASQCDQTICAGDTLFIPSEGVVALAWTWPVAVTCSAGDLHTIEGDAADVIADAGWSAEQIGAAVAVATKHGLPLAEWARQ